MRRLGVVVAAVLAVLPAPAGRAAERGTGVAEGETRGRRVRVVALSAGREHFQGGNPGTEANFAHLLRLAEESVPQRPDIICFPEFTTTGWPYPAAEVVRATAESVPGEGPCYRRYVELARKSGAVVCGWLVEKVDARTFANTAFLVGPDGRFLGKYRKVHPTASEEGQWGMAPGTEIPVFDVGFARVGIAICWDMDFPEVCRSLMLRGADLVLHPTVANDRRDICPVRCKENALPMVISVFQESSYAVDAGGAIVADLGGRGGAVTCDLYPFDSAKQSKYGLAFDRRDILRARRQPGAYGALTDPALRLSWTEVFETKEGAPLPEEELRRRFPRLRLVLQRDPNRE